MDWDIHVFLPSLAKLICMAKFIKLNILNQNGRLEKLNVADVHESLRPKIKKLRGLLIHWTIPSCSPTMY